MSNLGKKTGVGELMDRELERLKPDRVFVVTDSNVDRLTTEYLPGIERIVIPAGEENKNIHTLSKIWSALTSGGATRRSLVINLGGGMVTDIGGFAAATFKRGIAYVNLSTTVLAAVDAAIGGKTAIDFDGLKNQIGAFREPNLSTPLFETFATLPHEQLLSGYGEMLKTGLLMGEEEYRKMTKERFLDIHSEEFRKSVDECADYKRKIVAMDLTEQGLRRVLNLGHTYGHAFESLALEKGRPVAHGIAVAHGLLCTIILSKLSLQTDSKLLYGYNKLLKERFPALPLQCSDVDRIVELMGHDKKNRKAGQPEFVLLKEPGETVMDLPIRKEEVTATLDIYMDLMGQA